MDAGRLARIQEVLGYRFAAPALLVTALTHPSYAAEHPRAVSYERLEFLGDAVLGLIVSERLYREFPDAPEGDLTRRKHAVVAGDALALAAREIGLAEFVLLGAGAGASGDRGRNSVLENVTEAIIGAIYLDGGMDAASAFVSGSIADRLATPEIPVVDSKGALQQHTQALDGSLPVYRITSVSGPVHERTFTAQVSVRGAVVGTGTGCSKQSAEKAAAAEALGALREAPGGTPD